MSPLLIYNFIHSSFLTYICWSVHELSVQLSLFFNMLEESKYV